MQWFGNVSGNVRNVSRDHRVLLLGAPLQGVAVVGSFPHLLRARTSGMDSAPKKEANNTTQREFFA